MGIFKKIFKGIGKVFKKIGKFIKKGWGKLGKFMNKLGIVGQIGMMFITGGLANMAFAGLQTLGQGFMTGLANAGWAAPTAAGTAGATAAGTAGAAAGKVVATQVAKEGIKAGTARLAHGILTGASKIATTGSEAIKDSLGWITDNVIGAVTDVTRAVGNTVKAAATDVTSAQLSLLPNAVTFDKVLTRAATRLKGDFTGVTNALGDLKTFAGDIMPEGDPYAPSYETFTLAKDEPGLFGKRKGDVITRETTYDKGARDLYRASPEFQKQWAAQNKQTVARLGLDSSAIQPDFEGLGPTPSPAATAAVRPGDPFTLPTDDPLGLAGQEGYIDPQFETFGPKVSRAGVTSKTGLLARTASDMGDAFKEQFTRANLKTAVVGEGARQIMPQPDYMGVSPTSGAWIAQGQTPRRTEAAYEQADVLRPISQESLVQNDSGMWNDFFTSAFGLNPYPNASDIWNNKETPFASY